MNREGLVYDVVAAGHLGHSNHRIIVFNSLRSKNQGLHNCYLGIPECRLFTCLGDRFMDPLVKQSRMAKKSRKTGQFSRGKSSRTIFKGNLHVLKRLGITEEDWPG